MPSLRQALPLQISHTLNSPQPLSLEALRGKVIVLKAFQMLCPGCISHALPQMQRIHEAFSRSDVAVIGLHTVFEHHEAQGTPEALKAFLHEYRIHFPVAIDQQNDGPLGASRLPKTMQAYNMQGTPTLILIDREGYLRMHKFGGVDDLKLGAAIQALIYQPSLST
jgi:peroxiredoxin